KAMACSQAIGSWFGRMDMWVRSSLGTARQRWKVISAMSGLPTNKYRLIFNAMVEAEIFKALADPTRRAVFERLSRGEMHVTELKAGFKVSQPAISQHLSALKGAGLVSERREGRPASYRSDPSGLAPVADWI